jgi:hypothetical protein
MTRGKRLTFICDVYRGCQISAMAIYDSSRDAWIPRAHTYWKRGSEKHLGTLTDSQRFESSHQAQSHALALAHQWCDEHMVDFEPVPRR